MPSEAQARITINKLATVTVDENYIAVSQDAAWLTYSSGDRAA